MTTRTRKTVTQQLREQKAKNKELTARLEDVLTVATSTRVEEKGNGHGTPAQVAEVIAPPIAIPTTPPVARVLPPQPMPKKKRLFHKKQPIALVSSVLIKPEGLYLKKIKEADLPPDARLWRYEGNYVYSLVEAEKGKYELFEPTGETTQLPERLWRAVKAAPIRKVFTYKDRGLEKLNVGLGIAFVIVCMVVLFIIAQTSMK
jgi:hypothetical protein